MIMKKCIRAISNWKDGWKFASIQWSAIGLIIIGSAEFLADTLAELPIPLSSDMTSYISMGIFVLTIIGRLLVITDKGDSNEK